MEMLTYEIKNKIKLGGGGGCYILNMSDYEETG